MADVLVGVDTGVGSVRLVRALIRAEESEHEAIVVNLSGRGDKDVEQAAELVYLQSE